MCKARDIIIIDSYESQGTTINRHSFVVLSDEGGEIYGLRYDFVCNVLSSFKNETQKQRKLSFPGNFPITAKDVNVENGNKKDGYIKSEQFYYFKKEKISYKVIGNMTHEAFNELIDFIESLDTPIEDVIENL